MHSSLLPSLPPNRHGRRFDQATYNQITGIDARLLEAIRYDSHLTQAKSPTRAQLSYKPQAYWAKVLGCCRATINRRIGKLRKIGILDITRRRKLKGHWQTNMTHIRSWKWWRIGKALLALRKSPQPCNKDVTHRGPYEEKENLKTNNEGPVALFTQQILARWEQRGLLKPQAVP